ncbi:MAG: Mth938-like domain-containing protein [Thermomonas sp.]
MQLNLERPDYRYFMRGANGTSALVNEQRLTRSFVISPNTLIEDWDVTDAVTMSPPDLDALLALQPELLVLGTGATQQFPPAAVMATCLQRGIGIEVMTNAAAARTYSVLAGEGRRVVAGFVLQT